MGPPKFLTGADNVFLAIEDEHHLMTVASIYTFKTRIDPAQIRKQVADFAKHTECCTRVVDFGKGIFGRNKWREVEMNIDDHFRVITVPAPGTQAQLAKLLGEEVSAPFDFSKPLWDTTFFDGLEDGGCVLFLKAHHAIADGQGFVRNLLAYVASLDPSKDRSALQYKAGKNATPTASPVPAAGELKKDSPPSAIDDVKAAKLVAQKKPQAITLQTVKATVQMILIQIYFLWLYIVNLLAFLVSYKRSFSRNKLTSQKQVGWSSTVLLDDVKIVKNALGVTVNDVLTSSLATAIERFLSKRGGVKDPNGFWFFIPTSLRQPDDWSVSNKTSGYVLHVPLSQGDTVRGIKKFNQGMKVKKGNPEAMINFYGVLWGYIYPQFVPRLFQTVGFNRIHAVVTNVPGPMEAIPWAGESIQEIVSFIPQAFPNSLGCTIYTYRGKVSLSVMLDLDDGDMHFSQGSAQAIVEEFEEVFAELKRGVEEGTVGGAVKDKSV
ncbi:hypothetical protein HK101_006230 [Irineochytrium annulatum]|nr:hypothetical protein HK101_006230 [Irineochytrium annulatum]